MECGNDPISKSRSDIWQKCQTLKGWTRGGTEIGGDFSLPFFSFSRYFSFQFPEATVSVGKITTDFLCTCGLFQTFF